MAKQHGKLKLGKGSRFVKRRLSWLPQEDLVQEADFCPLPENLGGHDLWLGLVVSHHDGSVLAQEILEHVPHVNDLGRLLADAMERYPKVYSEMAVNMVRAGEASGALDAVLADPAPGWTWDDVLPYFKRAEDLPRWEVSRLRLGLPDLPVLLAVVAAVGATWLSHELGLSPAMGAFIAGMLLAESPFATRIQADITPFRTLFVTLFFCSIGMLADPGWVAQNWVLLAGVTVANLVAERRGTTKPDEILIVGAHYDTIPDCPGANDNGTGTVATLALARRFAGRKTERTLRFVFFANEEPPYFQTANMGSLVYAKRCRQRKEKLVGMLSLETISVPRWITFQN